MRLTSLVIHNFKQFEHAELNFAPGFTVIKGANEAGKSTIQAAILAALFLDPGAPEEMLDQYTRWGQNERYRLRLSFEDGDTAYTLEKDFQQRTVELTWQEQDSGLTGSADDPAEVLRIVGNRLGATSLETYLNTACVRSEEVSSPPAATAPLSQRLQAKMTGGRQADATQVLRAIDRELTAMTLGNLRRTSMDTGPLRLAHERVETLQQMHAATAEKLAAYQDNLQLLARRREDLRTSDAAIAEFTDRLELSDRVQTLEEECALLEEHTLELQRVEETPGDVTDLAEKLNEVDFTTLSHVLERVRRIESQLREAKEQEAEINQQLAILLLSQIQNVPVVSSTALLLGGVEVIIASAVAAAFTHIYPFALAAVLGVVLLVLGLRSRATIKVDSSQSHSDELNRAMQVIADLQAELQQVLSQYGLRSGDELAAVVRELQPMGDAHAARQQRVVQLLGDQRLADRQLELQRVAEEVANRRIEIAALAPHRLTAEAYQQADEQTMALKAQRDDRMRELYRLEGELSAYEVNSEMLATIDEELATEQVRLARIERRRKGLESARSGIRDALSDTLLQASAAFRGGLARYLSRITGGRYDQVEAWIDTDGLHLQVYAAGNPDPVEADKLSHATQDQIYLAARLTLLQLACEGRNPPLLLDDPFVNYDDDRLATTAALLHDLDADHQILLFTCTNRYDTFATTLLDLSSTRLVPEAIPPLPDGAAAPSLA